MTHLFTAMFFTFVGWAIGTGLWRNIWAVLLAALLGTVAYVEPMMKSIIEAL